VHFPIPQIEIYTTLTNLQFAFKFICRFIVGEGAFRGDEVENLLVFTIVVDVSSNQLSIPQHAPYVWPALKKKIPLAFNFAVHLFLLKCSPRPRLVKDINHGFKQQIEETFLLLCQCHSILPFIILH
jgi:hypothetical protein